MKLCVWPDGTWRHAEEVEDIERCIAFKGDDFERVDAPEVCDECLDAWCFERVGIKP